MKKILLILTLALNFDVIADFQKGFVAASKGDYKTALIEYKSSAMQNDVNSKLVLANMYYYGKGVVQNYQKSIYWYQQAAQQASPDAQYAIGIMYAEGQGVEQNLDDAKIWLEKVLNNEQSIDEIFEQTQAALDKYKIKIIK